MPNLAKTTEEMMAYLLERGWTLDVLGSMATDTDGERHPLAEAALLQLVRDVSRGTR